MTSNLGENVAERKQLEELLSRIPTLLNCPNSSVGVAYSIPPGSPKERKTHKGIFIRSPGLGKDMSASCSATEFHET